MFGFQNLIFWFYGLSICLLGGWLWHLRLEKNRQRERYFQFLKIAAEAQETIGWSAGRNLMQVQKMRGDYPCQRHDSLQRQALRVEKMRDDLRLFSNQDLALLPTQATENWQQILRNPLPTAVQIERFFQKRAVFADSLQLFSKKEKAVAASLDSFFSIEKSAAIRGGFASKRTGQRSLLHQILDLQHAAAAHRAMVFLVSQTGGSDVKFDGFLPMLNLSDTCFRVGETVRGEAFVAAFSSRAASNVAYFLNEKKLPIEQGLGKFTGVFRTAGLKNLTAKIVLKNPLTGEIRNYTKDFPIKICE